MLPLNAGIVGSPYRYLTGSFRGLISGRLPGARRWKARSATPSADSPASSADTTEADAYFATSAASSERANAKFFAARTNLLWGRMLAKRQAPGDAKKARQLLVKAHEAAVVNGYGNVERRAVAALQDQS